jgi:hypothetical protein
MPERIAVFVNSRSLKERICARISLASHAHPKNRGDEHQHGKEGQDHEAVVDRHEDSIHPAAPVACDQGDEHRDDSRQRSRNDSDEQ